MTLSHIAKNAVQTGLKNFQKATGKKAQTFNSGMFSKTLKQDTATFIKGLKTEATQQHKAFKLNKTYATLVEKLDSLLQRIETGDFTRRMVRKADKLQAKLLKLNNKAKANAKNAIESWTQSEQGASKIKTALHKAQAQKGTSPFALASKEAEAGLKLSHIKLKKAKGHLKSPRDVKKARIRLNHAKQDVRQAKTLQQTITDYMAGLPKVDIPTLETLTKPVQQLFKAPVVESVVKRAKATAPTFDGLFKSLKGIPQKAKGFFRQSKAYTSKTFKTVSQRLHETYQTFSVAVSKQLKAFSAANTRRVQANVVTSASSRLAKDTRSILRNPKAIETLSQWADTAVKQGAAKQGKNGAITFTKAFKPFSDKADPALKRAWNMLVQMNRGEQGGVVSIAKNVAKYPKEAIHRLNATSKSHIQKLNAKLDRKIERSLVGRNSKSPEAIQARKLLSGQKIQPGSRQEAVARDLSFAKAYLKEANLDVRKPLLNLKSVPPSSVKKTVTKKAAPKVEAAVSDANAVPV